MDSTIIAALIAVIGTIIAAIIQHRKSPKPIATTPDSVKENIPSPEETPEVQFARRYIDQPSHVRFITILPKLKTVVYEAAQEGWNTGVTSEMRNANYDVIDFLEFAWLRLADFYPPSHFGGKDSKLFIQEFIQERFSFHWSKHQPNGAGTGGTMVGVLTGGSVINDLEEMIADTVGALFMNNDDFNYQEWLKRWQNSNP